uniref:NADH-ubiquinone oxidoreductase chain 5 n=1 Tax=Sweltsa longistyla TaxID=1572085 RepID=A0A0C4Y139_9NEOP|nr:NADH dehydrogenase subunit 5 [Sweltsa longistyla]
MNSNQSFLFCYTWFSLFYWMGSIGVKFGKCSNDFFHFDHMGYLIKLLMQSFSSFYFFFSNLLYSWVYGGSYYYYSVHWFSFNICTINDVFNYYSYFNYYFTYVEMGWVWFHIYYLFIIKMLSLMMRVYYRLYQIVLVMYLYCYLLLEYYILEVEIMITIDFANACSTTMWENWQYVSFIGSLVYIGCYMTKSAQIPFSSWLPAAMAAPTPVSALVHSSTLVTAGVYLLIRFNVLLANSSLGSFLLLFAGLTMFMAGLGANFEFDLKKIIALSTLSQLGLMMSILAMGFPKLAFFHLLTHALFKALLFMCAGAIIHNMKDSQDIRFMGGLVVQMPLTSSCFNLSNLALCGMPFLAGFYSKDLILEIVSLSYLNVFSFILYFFSTGLTVCYSLRLVYYSMSGDFNVNSLHPLNDEGWTMLKGMMTLSLMAVLGGSLLSWTLFPTPSMICLPLSLKTLALSVSVIGGWLGYELAKFSLSYELQTLRFHFMTSFMGSMWFLPFLSTYGVSYTPLQLGSYVFKSFDQGWSEYCGAQGLYKTFTSWSTINQGWQNNDLKTYLISFMMWIIILLVLVALYSSSL